MSEERAGRELRAAPVPAEAPNLSRTAEQAEQIVDALDLLPPDKRGVLQSILISQESYSGPIPSPRILAGMETVVPGSARRVIDMAAKQQDFDHTFSSHVLTSESSYRIRTLLVAFLVLAGLIGGAIYCATIHETGVAITLGTVTGMSVLAGVILKGRDLFQGQSAPSPVKPKPTQPKPKGKAATASRNQRGR